MTEYGDDFAKDLTRFAQQVIAQFDKRAIERGDWQTLAMRLLIEGGHVKANKPAGAPPDSQVDLVVKWAHVQRERDANRRLSLVRACEKAGVSKAAYYRCKGPLVEFLQRTHAALGAERFWACFDVAAFEGMAGDVKSLMASLRGAAPGSLNVGPTVLTADLAEDDGIKPSR